MPERLERSEGPVINALLTFVEQMPVPRLHGSWVFTRVEPFFAPQAALFAVSH